MDILLKTNIDLCIMHIPGTQNVVANALSQYDNELTTKLVNGLTIRTFQPPRDALGVIKKWSILPSHPGHLLGGPGLLIASITSDLFCLGYQSRVAWP